MSAPPATSFAEPAVGPSSARKRQTSGPVLFACDAAYGMQLATCLRSIVEANPTSWPLDFHVLTDGFPEDIRSKVLGSLPIGSASIRWIPVNLGQFTAFSTLEYISTMTFARFMIPSVFPETVSRVLYLDADVLVLGDLAPLWETDLEGHPVGAVLDSLDSHTKANTHGFENVPRVRAYFNAGVLLIDLDRWRQERISERALDYLAHHPSSPYSDQDALNVACDAHWKRLDTRWNDQSHLDNRIADLAPGQLPRVVHFVTSLKPWKPRSLNFNTALYDGFRSRTRFARSLGEAGWDMVLDAWYRSRRYLKRYALLRAIWSRVVKPRDRVRR